MIAELNADRDLKTYIPLRCNIPVSASEKTQLTSQIFDLTNYLDQWIESDGRLLTILGDYGSGKTTFLKFAMHKYAKNIVKNNKNTRVPFLIRLRDAKETISH